MKDDTIKLVRLTLNRIKEDLTEKNLPVEKYFENENNVIIFNVKHNSGGDDKLIFTVGVCKKGTDVLFSNLLINAELEEILKYIEVCENTVIKYIENLSLKVDRED